MTRIYTVNENGTTTYFETLDKARKEAARMDGTRLVQEINEEAGETEMYYTAAGIFEPQLIVIGWIDAK